MILVLLTLSIPRWSLLGPCACRSLCDPLTYKSKRTRPLSPILLINERKQQWFPVSLVYDVLTKETLFLSNDRKHSTTQTLLFLDISSLVCKQQTSSYCIRFSWTLLIVIGFLELSLSSIRFFSGCLSNFVSGTFFLTGSLDIDSSRSTGSFLLHYLLPVSRYKKLFSTYF